MIIFMARDGASLFLATISIASKMLEIVAKIHFCTKKNHSNHAQNGNLWGVVGRTGDNL